MPAHPALTSPRTAEQPLAFTANEFTAGVFWAVLWFQPMAAAITLVIGLIVNPATAFVMMLIGGLVGLPLSIAAALVGAPLAFCIGRALSGERRDRVHLAVFSAYGIAVGLFTMDVVGLVLWGNPVAAVVLLPYALAVGVAVPLGWWKTSRSALAADTDGRTVPLSSNSPSTAGS
ncbi:hypothetical protein GCM10027414_13310 [Humibacter ginsengiterrae]